MPDSTSRDADAITELLSAYRTFDGPYDELTDNNGYVRSGYRRLIGLEPRLSGPEVYVRWRLAKQSFLECRIAQDGDTLGEWQVRDCPVGRIFAEWIERQVESEQHANRAR